LCYTYGDDWSSGGYGNNDELFKLFIPDDTGNSFWANDGTDEPEINMKAYTPLRQNIVLLMAAINGEL
jgi:hypothetical protein